MANSFQPPPKSKILPGVELNPEWEKWFKDLHETSKEYNTPYGIVAPRLTTTQRNAIVTPTNGLLIFNTTTGKPEMYFASAWHSLNYT